jgi:hypothetical protein
VAKEKVMSQGVYVKINHRDEIQKRLPDLVDKFENWDYSSACVVKLTPYVNPRTTSQNALFHKWVADLSQWVITRDPSYTKENVKLLLKQLFLGVEDVTIGKTVIKDQLRHTSNLDKGEMHHFMNQVYNWAFDLGLALTIPAQSEYRTLSNQQVK